MAERRLERLLARIRARGLEVDGEGLAAALCDRRALERLERLVEGNELLERVGRVEFICDGIAPPGLGVEPRFKAETVYFQDIDYDLCKACRLCIQVCPKRVYRDDGFGHPDAELRRAAECTGAHQCGQCVDVCPEHAIRIRPVRPEACATLYLVVPGTTGPGAAERARERDFVLPDPLAEGRPLELPARLDARSLARCHRRLDAAGFHPLLELDGYPRHLVDSPDPEGDLERWARAEGRDPERVLAAVRLLYRELPRLAGLARGSYRLGPILHRVIDELLHPGIHMRSAGARELLRAMVAAARIERPFAGAKTRPIGGLLPAGTSPAWKTPYGNEIPEYVHLERCLGPECGLCVTQCPEGGGGERGAIRMVLEVPAGAAAALVRGAPTWLARLDADDPPEELSGRQPFHFVVDPDYCKACGLCIACCPHDVIEPAQRVFDLARGAA